MITLYYHLPSMTWAIQGEKRVSFGNQGHLLPIPSSSSNMLSFLLNEKNGKIGPLVGILTGNHPKKLFSGDQNYYIAIQKALERKGGLSFVFTLNDVNNETMFGYTFYRNQWEKIAFPYPDIVYNRIPTKKQEASDAATALFKNLEKRQIPYFNPFFFDKWEMVQLLAKNDKLRPFIPETILLNDQNNLQSFLKKHRFLYAKPVSASTGNGIFTLTENGDGNTTVRTHDDTTSLSDEKLESFISHLLKKERYILQQGIILDQYKEKPYDFRILMQKPANEWQMTGAGIRMAPPQGITTHVPKGGAIFSIDQITPSVNKQNLVMLGTEIASTIEAAYGMVKECSIDIGRDRNGNDWIFEANAKPMSFDEQDIEERRIKSLVDTLFHETQFSTEKEGAD